MVLQRIMWNSSKVVVLSLLFGNDTKNTVRAFSISNTDPVTTPKAAAAVVPDFLQHDVEVQLAIAAVRKACGITESLQPDTDETLQYDDSSSTTTTVATIAKADMSLVTVADFAVQASILHDLDTSSRTEYGYIAEEDTKSMTNDDVLAIVSKHAGLTVEETRYAIDLGKDYETWYDDDNDDANIDETSTNKRRRPKDVWCLDPIDGTRGFLRGRMLGQYAIALAKLENGIPTIGILGCPNLETKNGSARGCIFVAKKGCGTYQIPIHDDDDDDDGSSSCIRKCQVTNNRPVHQSRFCLGVEQYSDALGLQPKIMAFVHGDDEATTTTIDKEQNTSSTAEEEESLVRRMDSQAKHGVLARGDAELYARLPKQGYIEYIWDHAAGYVVITEAGGKLTDTTGAAIDFGRGRHQLSPDVVGVLMSSGEPYHTVLVEAYAAAAATKKNRNNETTRIG